MQEKVGQSANQPNVMQKSVSFHEKTSINIQPKDRLSASQPSNPSIHQKTMAQFMVAKSIQVSITKQ